MSRSDNLYALPTDLPVPVDDGACDHLPGLPWPSLALQSTRGRSVFLADVEAPWPEARGYVAQIDPRVVLIDGKQLAEYMLDYGLGVTTRATYELKRVDSDYFIEQ